MIRRILRWTGRLLLASLLACAAIVGLWLRELPPLPSLDRLTPSLPSIVLARSDEKIAEFSRQPREIASLSEMPDLLIQAVLAAEDQDFHHHWGVDLEGVLRAAWANLRQARVRQGGSTITQQLAKLSLLSSERTLRRKALELILALELEQAYGKSHILELYLNTVYFGHGAYGIKTAAGVYFSKPMSSLTLAECALLAGLIQGPSVNDPFQAPARALERRQFVLRRLESSGRLPASALKQAMEEPLSLRPPPTPIPVAPDLVEAVRRDLVASLGAKALYAGGLRVETTLSPPVQTAAEQALEAGLLALEKRLSWKGAPLQGAVLVLESESGDVLAMVGGRGQAAHRFNRALQARRQPGSLFKPVIYAAALDSGYSESDVLEDLPFELLDEKGRSVWSPENFDHSFHGPVPLREALVHSLNIVTIRLAASLGIDGIQDYAARLGVESKLPPYLSIALGSGEVSLLEMMSVYGCFATGGLRVRPRWLRQVTDREGALLLQRPILQRPAIPRGIASRMARLLREVVERGTGKSAAVEGVWVGGKTGTTNDAADVWFIGLAPPLAIGIWMGSDDRRPMGRETGGTAAAPVFRDLLERLRGRFAFRAPPHLSEFDELR